MAKKRGRYANDDQRVRAARQRIEQERKRRGEQEHVYQKPEDAGADLNRALELMDGETADEIIGPDDTIDPILLDAVKAENALLIGVAKQVGQMRVTRQVNELLSRALLVRMHLVHGAYALGIKEGRRREKEGASGDPR